MYLFIYEDGSLLTTNAITNNDKSSVSSGILSIVDMEDGSQWVDDGEWVKIEHYSE